MQVWISLWITNRISVVEYVSLKCSQIIFLTSTPAKRSSRKESSGGEPAVISGQWAEHLRDGWGLSGLLNYLQTQWCHWCPDTGTHAGREYVPVPVSSPAVLFSVLWPNSFFTVCCNCECVRVCQVWDKITLQQHPGGVQVRPATHCGAALSATRS